MNIKFFTGTVMSNKTKLLIDFLSLLMSNEYILGAPSLLKQSGKITLKSKALNYTKKYEANLIIEETTDIYEEIKNHMKINPQFRVLFIDEVQFLTTAHIDQLKGLSNEGINVFVFGISHTHQNEIWPTVEYLQEESTVQRLLSTCFKYDN